MPESSVDPQLAGNIRRALKDSGRSAYAVSKATGHAPNWLHRVITGKTGLLIPTLRQLAQELGVTPGSLLDSSNTPSQEETQVMTKVSLPPGTYFIGDPVNVLSTTDWGTLVMNTDPTNATSNVQGVTIAIFEAPAGDGVYADGESREYTVDSGAIAAVPEALFQKGPPRDRALNAVGRLHHTDQQIDCTQEQNGTISIGPFTIMPEKKARNTTGKSK